MPSHAQRASCSIPMNPEIKNNKSHRLNFLPLVAAIALALNSPVQAATFTVSNTNDSGSGSLRQAVSDANALTGADKIEFDAALTGQKITLSTGEIEISDELIITGSITGDASSITIDGDNKSRIFHGKNNAAITLENMTLTHGKETATTEDYYSYDQSRRAFGGAIRADGALVLSNTIINDNYAGGEYYGYYQAIFTTGNITLSNSKVINNHCGGVKSRGGKIIVQQSEVTGNKYDGISGGTINVDSSIISHNSGSGISGGSSITINASTISDNTRLGVGGASVAVNHSTISNNNGTGINGNIVTVNQSTISANSEGILAKEIQLNQSTVSGNQYVGLSGVGANFIITQSTITNNRQVGINLSTYYYSFNNSATLTSINSIISGNIDNNITINKYDESHIVTINATNSLIGDDPSKINGTNVDNIFNNVPYLSPLQANGGATLTHFPKANSPVLDKGNNDAAVAFTHDQRGSGFDRIYNNTVDIGAVEYKPFSWSIDGSAQAEPLTDGLLALRYIFGFKGDALIDNAIDADATLITANEIQIHIQRGIDDGALDIDGNGEVKPLTDGLLLLRYLFGFKGDSLINNAVANNATRQTATEIEAYLASKMP